MSLQALHLPAMTMAIPMPELASENASKSCNSTRAGMALLMEGRSKIGNHQSRSEAILFLAD
jgi:hypothetical protein